MRRPFLDLTTYNDAVAAGWPETDLPMALAPQVVRPDRRVRQRRRPPGRPFGIGRSSFSLPPRAAGQRALSRAIRAGVPWCRDAPVMSATVHG